MVKNFEKLRSKLDKAIEIHGVDSEKASKLSKRYTELVNCYYREEKQFHENNLMYLTYLESLNSLRKITKDFVKFPTIEEWNYYAKENGLLNSESLKYISGNDWHELRNAISSQI